MLPLASADLDGSETKFQWPEKKKDLFEVATNNKVSPDKLEIKT